MDTDFSQSEAQTYELNSHHQRREPAVTDFRIVIELNSWPASAAWYGSAGFLVTASDASE
jgi:hypothetical protein